MRMLRCGTWTLALMVPAAVSLIAASTLLARAQEASPIVITLTDDKFAPAEVTVPAGKPFTLKVVNQTAAAAEFEAQDLKIEKVMAANSDATVSVRAMEPGKYLFVNEYKEDTVKGYVVVK